MRKSIGIAILLGVFCFEFAAPPPVQAQGFGTGQATVVDTFEMKRVRRKRKLYGMVGFGVVGVLGFIYIMMNSIDRRAARKAQQQRMLERQEQGLL